MVFTHFPIPTITTTNWGLPNNVKDFGAVGDGSTDDTAAINVVEALPGAPLPINVPTGRYLTSLTFDQNMNQVYLGPGQLIMSSNGQAPWRSIISTSQSVVNPGSGLTMFDTGMPHAYRASYSRVAESANPAVLPSSYTNYIEWAQDLIQMELYAGFNTNAADHALGRSGTFLRWTRADHKGGGDFIIDSHFAQVHTSRVGATHFLANPAIATANGGVGIADGIQIVGTIAIGSPSITAATFASTPANGTPLYGTGIPVGTTVTNVAGNVVTMSANSTAAGVGVTVMAGGGWGCYLQGTEYIYSDSALTPAACIAHVHNFHRNNANTAGLDLIWIADRVQSGGSVAIDCAYSVFGLVRRGLDFTPTTFDSEKAAIILKPQDRIYFAGTSTSPIQWFAQTVGNTWIEGHATNLAFVANGFTGLNVQAATNAVNSLVAVGQIAGTAPQLVASGTDADIDVRIFPKGTGIVSTDAAINSGVGYQRSGVQVVGQRNFGWSAFTGATDKSTVYDPSTITLAQLGARVSALQAALTTHGLIGA